ncbi:MAG: dihydroorotate dehydrogenase electron transfer subunit [Thermoplasmata archaeon]
MRHVVRVTDRVQETPSTVTLRFPFPGPIEPGQFLMIWLPGDDELPMSVSYTEGGSKGLTIKAMGDASRRAQSIRPGDPIGLRGPYGNRFDLSPRAILIVAGGSGAAVLAPAAERARAAGATVTVALGATTRAELLFRDRFVRMGARVEVATDDGSEGETGFVTGVAARLAAGKRFDAVWTCGPEVMMQKVAAMGSGRGMPVYCAVERHMKCALGMCDACALGPFHVCIDGPVFDARQLVDLPEFARSHRDASGRRRPF